MPQEGQDGIGVELHRIDSLDSDEDFGVYQRRARAGSSVSVLQRKTLLRSLQAGELRGGPDASIEELSMLAKKDPHKIMISELKRKLEPSESMTQSRPKPKSQRPQKRKSKSLTVQEEAQFCQWPAKSEQDGSFQRQFVQCDNCDLWYHFDCAGICEGDPRLEEPDSVFICPPCWYVFNRSTMRRRAGACARPDCSLTQRDTEEFVIERLVGRKTVGQAGYLFLVKWEGYPIAQASWTPEGSISGVSQVFDRFVADATAEGIDLDPNDAILLEEARHGGWDI
ncbi:hypothetical protein EDD22DRAFT_777108 [Suillus occidentalis]|nr:hypothetical protein EDD22DRAFT_777108 [Suillus occidentalis]